MRTSLAFIAIGIWFGISASDAAAQEQNVDVALVSAMQGEVNFRSKDGPERPAIAFMRVRHGDILRLTNGASIRLSYTTTARQESWNGAGRFVVTLAGGELLSGAPPVVVQLPAAVPQKLARVAELMKVSHMGGSVVRSPTLPTDTGKDDLGSSLREYEGMRANAAAGDITPELFLYSVFYERRMNDDLSVLVAKLLTKYPDNPEMQVLAEAALELR